MCNVSTHAAAKVDCAKNNEDVRRTTASSENDGGTSRAAANNNNNAAGSSSFLAKLQRQLELPSRLEDWRTALEQSTSQVELRNTDVSLVSRRSQSRRRRHGHQTPAAPKLSSFPCITTTDVASSVDFARSDSSSEWPPVIASAPPPAAKDAAYDDHRSTAAAGASSTSFFRSYMKYLAKKDEPPAVSASAAPSSESRPRLRRATSTSSDSRPAPPPAADRLPPSSRPVSEASGDDESKAEADATPPEPPPTGAPHNGAKVRQQLAAMAGQIRGFESQLLSEIEQRKQASAGRLAVVRDAVTQLKRTLEVEITRRVEMQKDLHANVQQEISEIQGGVAAAHEERKSLTESVALQLRRQVEAAEAAASELLTKNEAKLDRITQAVDLMATQIDSFKNRLTADIQLRRQRSDVLFEKLGELERAAQSRAAMETGLREKDKEGLARQMFELRQEQQSATTVLQEKIATEFQNLKDTLEKETKTREQADDDIVRALNHYTVALQNALRIANA